MARNYQNPTPTFESLSDKDQLEVQLADLTDKSLNDRPLGPAETRETRIRWLMTNDPAYAALAEKVIRATTAGPTQKSALTAQLQKDAAFLIEKAADEVLADADQRGLKLSAEAARTLVRKNQPDLAAVEMGRRPSEE